MTPVTVRILLGLMLLGCLPLAGSEAFIAHPDLAGTTLSSSEVGDILHGRRTTWPNGTRIVLITLDDSASPVTASVLKEYARKSPAQFLAYWKRQVFTGKGALPRQARDEADLLQLVATTPGALGFIAADKVSDAVTTVTIR